MVTPGLDKEEVKWEATESGIVRTWWNGTIGTVAQAAVSDFKISGGAVPRHDRTRGMAD